jgi:GMP synthase (glutamine-hydrolysing)
MECLALRHVAFEDAGLLDRVLAGRGIALGYLDVGVDTLDPNRIGAADLLLILGGPIGVYETREYPFLVAEIAAVGARLKADRPTLGICLGAQLMAAALGARVAPGPAKEIGYAPVDLTEAGRHSVLAALDGVPVLHWHGDNLELPDHAARLASTNVCPVQAFSIGVRALGLQFHIEAEPRRIERWLIGHAVELGKAGIDPGLVRQQVSRFGDATAAAGRDVFTSWLASVGL